jgi:hypothetical protein
VVTAARTDGATGEEFVVDRKLILHDLPAEVAHRLLPQESQGYTLYSASPAVRHCVGCFGCWVKTPGVCVIKDRGSDFALLMSQHSDLIVLSRLVFGGLSPDVKAIIDRSIGFILPFFRIVNGEAHHAMRYEKSPNLHYILYGSNIRDAEKETAQRLVAANALNFGAARHSIGFYASPDAAGEVFA